MFKRLLVYTVMISTVFLSLRIEIKASDWPERNLNQTLNRHIIDPSLINSSVVPFSIEVAHNTQDVIAGGGYVFYSDGLSQSTVYAVNMLTQSIAWSKQYPKQVARIVYNEGKIYFGADKFYCLNALNGSELWATSPGKFGSVDYYTRIYQYDEQYIYGFRYYSNMYKLAILDKFNGAVKWYSEIILTDFINDVAVWQNRLYITIGRSGLGGSQLSMFDLSNYTYTIAAQTCRSNGAKMIIDGDNNQAVLTAPNAAICSYQLDNLSAVAVNRMINLERYIKYNDRYYSVYGEYSKSMPANNTLADVSQTKVLDPAFENFQSDPLIVNEHFFAGTSKSGVWSKNLETGQTKYASISAEGAIRQMIYASGCIISLIGYGTSGDYKAKIVFSDINNLSASPTYQISVTSPYNTAGMNQYLGQLHCHYIPDFKWSKLWNLEPNPAFTVEKYKQSGYDFVALTEHNQVVSMPVVDEGGILQIVNAMESTQGWGKHHLLAIDIDNNFDNSANDQLRIDTIENQGGISIFAHPDSWVYGALTGTINKLRGIDYLEVYNHAVQKTMLQGYAIDDFDKLEVVRNNKYITAGDDYTPGGGFFDGGAVEVFASSNSQQDIMSNIRSGNFYALQGSKAPKLNIQVIGNSFTVSSDQSSNITFIGKGGKKLRELQSVNTATYYFQGDEIYVRAEVESVESGLKSWTQALTVEPTFEIFTINGGNHNLTLGQAVIYSNTSEPVSAKILNRSSYPNTTPELGYLSPIYQFTTSGEVLNGNRLVISYAEEYLPIKPENLAIFTYNEKLGQWVKCASSVDEINKIVTTELPHYSLYTLSAEIPEDTEAPTIVLSAPDNLNNLASTVDLSATASDNQAVTSVRFLIDGKQIGSDIIPSDGWTSSLNAANFTNGVHKLILVAEDYAGNTTNQSYDITIASGITAPTINITSPTHADYLYDPSSITGSYTSQLELMDISIYLDDIYINKADINNANMTFNMLINWSQFKEGVHTLKLKLEDIKGNSAMVESNVTIGLNVTANIISPQSINYLRGELLPISIATNPENADVKIYLDSAEISNNTSINLIDYALGDHTIEVKFGDQTIANTNFSIITDYEDTIQTVKRFNGDGLFKNNGIYTATIAHLRVAEQADKFGLKKIEKTILQGLIMFINQQAWGKKPKLDERAREKLVENIKYLLQS